MKLNHIHLRYYPPGLILEYKETNGRTREKTIDLLDLNAESNTEDLADLILDQLGDSWLPKKHQHLVSQCLDQLKKKTTADFAKKFHSYRMMRAHAMPITDVTVTRDGSKCLTTSYDRTCKIWDLSEGKEVLSLAEHTDIVCCVAINPTCDRVLTGSFDSTVRFWRVNLEEGKKECECLHVLRGAEMTEVQTAQFSPDFLLAAAGSSDATATVYDLTSGIPMYTFDGHDAEISSVGFDNTCQSLLTGSFDSLIGLWDLRSGNRIAYFRGHEGEVVTCMFNYACDKIASGSMDSTVRIWDIRNDKSSLSVFKGHSEEVTDVQFDYRGKSVASCSKNGQLLISDVPTCTTRYNIQAHQAQINRVRFSPNGGFLITISDDSTTKMWLPEVGTCTQTLEGHSGKVTSGCVNYLSDTIVTVATDNTCRVWK